MMELLSREFEFYQRNKDDLLARYRGKYIAVVDESVVGSYDTYQEAVTNTAKQYKPGTFFIQRVTAKDEVVILSRVVP